MPPALGFALFLLSAALAVYTAYAVARRFAACAAELYWFVLLGVASQLGLLPLLLSLFNALTPWGFILAQAALAAVTARFTRGPRPGPVVIQRPSRLMALLLCLLVGVLAFSLLQQALVSRIDGDSRMYHASRVAYWLQHQSLMPWTTHNDRQVSFGFGSELFFFWPVLFTRNDLTGFLLSWIAMPLSTLGVYFSAREFRLSRLASLAAAILFTCTPRIIEQAHNMKPEPWVTVFALGVLFWSLRAYSAPGSAPRSLMLASCFAVLAINAKFYAAPLLVAVFAFAAIPWDWRKVRAALAGAGVMFVASGLAVPVVHNLAHYGHPFGSESFRKAHAARISLNQIRVHLIRLPVLLFDPPWTPSTAWQQRVQDAGQAALAASGAVLLPAEDSTRESRSFQYRAFPYAVGYSLGGIVWLPMLCAAFIYAWRRGDRMVLAATLLAAVSLFSVVLLLRWTSFFDVPSRFMASAYALSVPIGAVLVSRLPWRRAPIAVASFMLASVAVIPSAGLVLRTLGAIDNRADPELASNYSHWRNAIAHLPPGSRILVFANASAADYDLFLPKLGYPNYVVSWGRQPFSPGRLERLVAEHRITHIVIQNSASLSMSWDPPLVTSGLVEWLSSHPEFSDVPGIEAPVRVFWTARWKGLPPSLSP